MIQALLVFGIIYAYIFVGVLVYKVLRAVVGCDSDDIMCIGCVGLWPLGLPCLLIIALIMLTGLLFDQFVTFVSGFWESLRA